MTMTNEKLMEKIVEVRTEIARKERNEIMDGTVELLYEFLDTMEEDAKDRITALNEQLDEAEYEGDSEYIELLQEELDYMEMMLWEITGFSGDTDGDN